MISLRQPLRLWAQARDLRLGLKSTVSYIGAYYFGRRPALRKLFWNTVVLDVPAWGKIPIRSNGYDHTLLSQIFVRKDYQIEARDVSRVLDLGANIGMATLYLSRLFPGAEFACVEPSPQNTPLLKQSIALNGIRGRVFEAAIGAEEGEVDLYLSPEPDCTSIHPGNRTEGVVRVPQISVPQVLQRIGWDRVDLLKIDIEGAEKSLLSRNNSWLHNVRNIVGESHVGVDYPYAQLVKDLSGFGFEVKTLIEETEVYGASFHAVNTRLPAPVGV